jgi:hypothetical protein
MTDDGLTALERAVLNALLAGEHPSLEALRAQLRTGCVRKRELTGCGFLTELEVDRRLAPARVLPELRLGDVDARIAGLEHGAGFVLLVKEGYLDVLEGYSYDEPWPALADEFSLSYEGGSRDLAALHLDAGSKR